MMEDMASERWCQALAKRTWLLCLRPTVAVTWYKSSLTMMEDKAAQTAKMEGAAEQEAAPACAMCPPRVVSNWILGWVVRVVERVEKEEKEKRGPVRRMQFWSLS
jgi:hypothetical protein